MTMPVPGSEVFSSRPVDPEELRRSLPPSLRTHTVSQQQIDALDPLTYEVVRHRLWSITDEMGEALKRMSGSPIVTDANGRYQFRSNVPTGYGCPPQGTTQRLLDRLARHGQRPAHIHFFVSADGHRKLTTQINIDGDKYLWDDFAFASREGLVPAVNRIADAAALDQHGVDQPFASIDFDFRLLPEQEGAPPAEVERLRAAA